MLTNKILDDAFLKYLTSFPSLLILLTWLLIMSKSQCLHIRITGGALKKYWGSGHNSNQLNINFWRWHLDSSTMLSSTGDCNIQTELKTIDLSLCPIGTWKWIYVFTFLMIYWLWLSAISRIHLSIGVF